MTSTANSSVRLSKPGAARPLSKVRAQFNNLIKKLESERARLAAWHDAIPRMRARAEAELKPLEERYRQRVREMIILLDDAFERRSFKHVEREKLSSLICELSFDIDGDEERDELEAIYAKHGVDDDDVDLEMLKDLLGEFMDPAGLDDDARREGAAGPGEQRSSPGDATRAERKPTAKEARKAAEELRLHQSVREVFRKLASALHPDRAEDGSDRERKTALMQRANAAYASHDLLALLELQFEVEQIDQASLEALGDDRIKLYNKVLTKQVNEVRRDIETLEHWVILEAHIAPRAKIAPAILDEAISEAMEDLREDLAAIERDLLVFKDGKALKAFLKTYRIRRDPGFFDENLF